MKIYLSPRRMEQTLSVVRAGDVLTVNGEAFNFKNLQDGDTLPSSAIHSDWFAGDANRIDGEIELTLILPLPTNYSPEQAFPVPLENVPDGPVFFPAPLRAPEIDAAPEVIQ